MPTPTAILQDDALELVYSANFEVSVSQALLVRARSPHMRHKALHQVMFKDISVWRSGGLVVGVRDEIATLIELFDNANVAYALVAGMSCQLDSVLLMAEREHKTVFVVLGDEAEAEALWKAHEGVIVNFVSDRASGTAADATAVKANFPIAVLAGFEFLEVEFLAQCAQTLAQVQMLFMTALGRSELKVQAVLSNHPDMLNRCENAAVHCRTATERIPAFRSYIYGC
ncbi:hypothetical protein DV532_27995 (plasmid) [Pseudomonas sp. Leaf58]|uniref:hypothetical protein n=1 Tax=Pseudomonas sp. Leaf58 TaxID=1736226 RepID=UPI0006FE2311|nr:hypothetical protein [Pseudomonas sp. Leaf58]AYG48120.1 hypothetical protein DV532_27995 [Pseudomonas sp. Leaf58]KQN62326.1 hypothetical protein ASF02_09225 [Pseudomonas sp. Leaf58]